jgi:hypothetical protein
MITRVSLSFATLPDGELAAFALAIIDHMTGKDVFPTPPVSMAALRTGMEDFNLKIAAAKTGGPPDTALKNEARQVLLGMLRQLAGYVQIQSNNEVSTLLSSGFLAMSTNRAQTPLEPPVGLTVRNAGSGRLVASVNPVKNTSMYEGRIKGPTGDATSAFSGDSQHIVFEGLTAGTNYTIQVRALGGLTGHSEWSDLITHMSL